MLVLLSPAKALDYETPVSAEVWAAATEPEFTLRAQELIQILQPLSTQAVAHLMDLSEPLAALNVGRYAAWQTQATEYNSKPAVLAFNGDVYEGLAAPGLSLAQLQWAQSHLLILSGLYGALRPLDKLQPYRLEMGTKLVNEKGSDLYAFWGGIITQYINQRIAQMAAALGGDQVVVNLASQEYFKSVKPRLLHAKVVECVFEDEKAGIYKVVSFYAKRARGLMARFIIENRLEKPDQLIEFASEGYHYAAEVSTDKRWVFRRKALVN
jgi:cytoplasmic iron level regulating protein YaaA (DUF328/UPF0246 family)